MNDDPVEAMAAEAHATACGGMKHDPFRVELVAPAIKEPPPPIGPTEAIVLELLLSAALLAARRYQLLSPGATTARDVLDATTAYTLLKAAL